MHIRAFQHQPCQFELLNRVSAAITFVSLLLGCSISGFQLVSLSAFLIFRPRLGNCQNSTDVYIIAARPADVFPWLVSVLLIVDHSCPFVSKKSWKKWGDYDSEQVQGSDGDGALRRASGPSARPENDRKTAGFTNPLKPELNFGNETVKVW
jgi:hypothetical protein